MKYIEKLAEPYELLQWKSESPYYQGRFLTCSYGTIGGERKRIVKKALLIDQGWLCCYTGQRLDASNDHSHIEHLKPQSICLVERRSEDIDYKNLFAAYGGETSNNCPYGAKVRGNWYGGDDPNNFVKPNELRCKSAFVFDRKGEIKSAQGRRGNNPAHLTIERLRLNHPELKDLRKAAIDAVLFDPNFPLEMDDIRLIANGAYSQKNVDGMFPEFCFAVEYVAQTLVQ